jgi:NADP-reducing hydrogenase subunit HndB
MQLPWRIKEKGMPAVKSLEELKHIREEILKTKQVLAARGNVKVIVTMGTCGIAAGALDTLKSILNYVENQKLKNVIVAQTGCIGLCKYEPIIQVVFDNQARIVYGKVDSQVAQKIMKQHVQNGTPVIENVIQI